jgi:hypothetical protein
MPWSLEELKQYVPRRVSLHRRGIITDMEGACGLLGEAIFTLVDNPQSWLEIVALLETVPLPLLSKVASNLADTQMPDGGWRWPPVGAISDPGGATIFRKANPNETFAVERLLGWLRDRVASGC